jgi:hypothetical protein
MRRRKNSGEFRKGKDEIPTSRNTGEKWGTRLAGNVYLKDLTAEASSSFTSKTV